MDKIHKDDDMFHGSLEHYDSVGNQMADFVVSAHEIVGNQLSRILELPCGYGRVTRKLVDRFGSDRVFVAELMVPAIEFCVDQFGVSGYQVTPPVNEFRNIPNAYFDVGVMGSLITHLSEENSKTILSNFFKKLKPGGIGVVTTHGVRARELLEHSEHYQAEVCQVGSAGRRHLIDRYDSSQFGYAKYVSNHTFEQKTVPLVGDSYGYSLIPQEWVEETAKNDGLKVVKSLLGCWDGHQDVFFIQR